jgi:hypothetical protein
MKLCASYGRCSGSSSTIAGRPVGGAQIGERVSSLEVRPNLSSFADQLAVMHVTQPPPFFEIFCAEATVLVRSSNHEAHHQRL